MTSCGRTRPGVVTNSPAVDATPAACYAHVNDRDNAGEIVAQLFSPRAGDGVDVVIGTGRQAVLAAAAAKGSDFEQQARRHGYELRRTLAPAGPETLVIFAADHSFDLRLRGGTKGESLLAGLDGPRPALRTTPGAHTGEEVLVAASGPGADGVVGFFPNTHLFGVMLSAFGWRPSPTPGR